MNTTDELLVAVMARIIKLEATTNTLAMLSLQHMADSKRSLKVLSEVFAELRAREVHAQIDSISVQFPQFAKFFREHAVISESDLRTFLDEQLEQDG
jgi:hypothetical protein